MNEDLKLHHQSIKKLHLAQLFLQDKMRFQKFSVELPLLLFDYSKQRVNEETITKLIQWAESLHLSDAIQQLFSGGIVNPSEQKPALHTALRSLSATPIYVNGVNIKPDIHATLDKMQKFIEGLPPSLDILCLGIGGSDLGPVMTLEALAPYIKHDFKFHFISNSDGFTLDATLKKLNPANTICIISSKTFTTPETLQNAKSVKAWFNAHSNHDDAHSHDDLHSNQNAHSNHEAYSNKMDRLYAVTANPSRAQQFGIAPDHIFQFWDWVGGRYSIWSAVGLPLAIALGWDQFLEFLEGAHAIDEHFKNTAFNKNIPVLMGLIGIWNINYFDFRTHAVIPYLDSLKYFPAYLQQLEMESNGKSVNKNGEHLQYKTCPVVWGGVGCNGQHAYMQLLHQSSEIIPVDFILAAQSETKNYPEQQELLIASCLSQSKALMEGKQNIDREGKQNIDNVQPEKQFSGNRPSSTLIVPQLTPYALGSLIALYEHKVFVQGVLWNINSFDQWGVELGKSLTKQLLSNFQLKNPEDAINAKRERTDTDCSTEGLLSFIERSSFLERNQ